ncbi:CAAX amino protease [Escherichia coli]|nr:CAAX amino protease [Escherichia coli]
MIQTRNQYLQFMLVMLAAWGISWGSRFVMEQAVLLYGPGKKLFVLQSWCCSDVPAVCFPGIPPLDSSATGRWSAAQRWRTVAGRCDGRGVYRCIFCSVRCWLCLLSHL